jgi:CheY-like chemotaxis protein
MSNSQPTILSSPTAVSENMRPVLVVEDDPDAVILIKRTLTKAGIKNPIVHVADGDEAISYLDRTVTEKAALPLFVLLDLKLPRTDGFSVLGWIRSQPALKNLRINILSSSRRNQDIERAYKLGANSYLEKFPSVEDVHSVYQLANSTFSIDELDRYVFPHTPEDFFRPPSRPSTRDNSLSA